MIDCTCAGFFENKLSEGLEKWGRFVARRPATVFIGSLVFAAICMGGISMTTSETETKNLWTPSNAAVLGDADLYAEMFGSGFRIETMYFKKKGGGNVLTKDAFNEIYEFDTKFRRDLTVIVDDVPWNFTSICAKARPTDAFCLAGGSPLEFFYNITSHRIEMDAITSDAALLSAINTAEITFKPDGAKETFTLDIADRHDLLAGKVRDAAGKITSAETVKMTWFASRDWDENKEDSRCYNSETAPTGTKGCNPVLLWEMELFAKVQEWNEQSTHVECLIQAENSISEALGAVIGGDVILLNSGFGIIIIYCIVVLGKFHPVLSRSAVAFAGVASVGLSIGCTYGLNGYFGVPQTPVTSVLPFILLGIGVDDMFVLAGALERAKKRGGTIEDRIGSMMGSAGCSITMTSLTDALAFALGTTTSFPALRYFCIYAAIGIILDFAFQISTFAAAITWDEQRVEGQKRDCFCCVVCCYKDGPNGSCLTCCRIKDEDIDKTCCCGTSCMKEGGYLRGAIKDYYAPVLTYAAVKAVVIFIFLGLFAVGCYGVTQLTEDFSLRFFVNEDNPLQKVFDIQDNEYKTGTITVSVLLDHRKEVTNIPLYSTETRDDSAKLAAALGKFEWSVKDSVKGPLIALNEYIAEMADNFPLSPRFFWVPEKASFDWLARTGSLGSSTLYLDTLADDFVRPGNPPTTYQGGISNGTWARLRTDTYMENPNNNATMWIKDEKLFYDVLSHFITSAQGAQYRSYFSPHEWYEKFTEWIDNEPEIINEYTLNGATITLDKRRLMSRGFLNDVNNNTARPKDPTKFCSLLKFFLSTNETLKGMVQPPLGDNADCYPASGDYKMSRMVVDMKCAIEGGVCPNSNATAEIESMQGVRKLVLDIGSPLKPIAYSFAFLFSEQYAVVRYEALTNLGLALVAVAVVMFLLIAHPFTALLVVLNTAMVLADILGLMWLWDISLNSISIVNLVLAIGLAVDYSAHVAHAFMSAEGTRDERMVTALSEMGADVCHGAFSTFLAVLVLGASKSYIFRMFFKQFFGICFFGATHGLMLLPVVLSLVGPPTHKDHAHGGLTFEERTAASKDGSKHAPGAEEPKSSPHHVDVEMAAHYAEPKAVNTMSAVATTKNPNLEVGYGRPVGDA